MNLKDFIGKIVISSERKAGCIITKITASEISVRTEKPNKRRYYSHYYWETINGILFPTDI